MRRKSLAASLALAFPLLLLLPPVRDEIHWQLTRLRNSERGYRSYHASYNNPRHGTEALRIAFFAALMPPPQPALPDRFFWWWMRADGTAEACIEYLQLWPSGQFRAEATGRLDQLRWTEAIRDNTLSSFQRYLDDVEYGSHYDETISRQHQLQQDDRPFQDAANSRTAGAWTAFLQDYPGHRRAGEALAYLTIAQPDSIFRRSRSGELTISAVAGDLYRLSLIVNKRQPGEMKLSTLPGLYLKANNPRVMDLVATHDSYHTLTEPGNVLISTPAAGASMRKRLPTPDDEFTVLPAPPQSDLARLVAFFAVKMPEFRLRQGAIWVVTDNARWAGLKRYMYGQTGADPDIITGDEERDFDPIEAIAVIRILAAAGLDLRRYDIWEKDRETLFWSLFSLDIPAWRYLERADPGGIGKSWADWKAAIASRVAPLSATVLPVLQANPLEIAITAPQANREAAWLAWYLREQGHEVILTAQPHPAGTVSWSKPELAKAGLATASLVEHAFALRGRREDEDGVRFQSSLLDVSLSPLGTNDEELRRQSTAQTPKWLRWIP